MRAEQGQANNGRRNSSSSSDGLTAMRDTTSSTFADSSESDWALLAPYLEEQLARLERKMAHRFGHDNAAFTTCADKAGTSTPSTSASTTPRLGRRSASPETPPVCISPPPGLNLPPPGLFFTAPPAGFRPPPGLSLASGEDLVQKDAENDAPARFFELEMSSTASDASSEKVLATSSWTIDKIFKKLKSTCGFAVVSPALNLGPCSDLRLHFAPGEAWRCRSAQTPTPPEPSSSPRCAEVNGSIRLKAGDAPMNEALKVRVYVGQTSQGVLVADFTDRAVQELPLTVNWWEELGQDAQSLTIRLELVA